MNLIELRVSKKLTQTQLANELGVKRTSISMWENKKAFPKYDSLQKLADLFECSIDEIIKAIKKETSPTTAKKSDSSQSTKLT